MQTYAEHGQSQKKEHRESFREAKEKLLADLFLCKLIDHIEADGAAQTAMSLFSAAYFGRTVTVNPRATQSDLNGTRTLFEAFFRRDPTVTFEQQFQHSHTHKPARNIVKTRVGTTNPRSKRQ